jgi:hypothetical protein
MQLTIKEALEIAQVLPKLIKEKIPIEEAYLLSNTVVQLNDELRAFDSIRFKLIEEFGERDENNDLINEDNQYKIKDMEKFNEAYEKIVSKEIEIDHEPLSVGLFGSAEITIADMLSLKPLFKASD